MEKLAIFIIKLGVDKVFWRSIENIIREVAEETLDLTDEEKRQEAIRRIQRMIKREGREIKDSTLDLIFGAVFKNLKLRRCQDARNNASS